ncbi:MAG: hypothetical protein GC159_04775 [Phycisphaera sp.]|nr:hypothetical protein [Phycisphaera sp.]
MHRWTRNVAAVVTLGAMVALLAAGASAVAANKDQKKSKDDVRRERERLRDNVNDLEKQLGKAEDRRKEAKAKLTDADKDYEKASKALSAARDKQAEAHQAEAKMIADLKKLSDADPAMVKATAAQAAAQQRESAERDRVIAALNTQADYAAAEKALEAAQAKVDELKRTGLATAAQMQEASQAVIDRDQIVGGMREKALAGDGPYLKAHAEAVAASQAVAEIDRRQDEQMRSDPGRLRRLEATKSADERVRDLSRESSAALAEVNKRKAAFADADGDADRIQRNLATARARLKQFN